MPRKKRAKHRERTTVPQTVVIGGIRIPRSFLQLTKARRTQQENTWLLTAKDGTLVATFMSERELEDWWREFQESQGRDAVFQRDNSELSAIPGDRRHKYVKV